MSDLLGLLVRAERPGDVSAIRAVNSSAFGSPAEANLVDVLRQSGTAFLSRVAVVGATIVGHILFTPVLLEDARPDAGQPLVGMGLAPMAVLPEYQRRGIGSQLVRDGLGEVRRRGYPFVAVVGHPQYYPRFGFTPASQHGVACQWPGIPDEAFMLLVLDERVMAGVAGVAKYRTEFDAVT